jgi:hypothetical protein
MTKKQKVRFHKGDRRPRHDTDYETLSYNVKMKKRGRKILWTVIEQPTNKTVAEYFFEEDAQKMVDFQNKHRVWQFNGGIPSFLWIRA